MGHAVPAQSRVIGQLVQIQSMVPDADVPTLTRMFCDQTYATLELSGVSR